MLIHVRGLTAAILELGNRGIGVSSVETTPLANTVEIHTDSDISQTISDKILNKVAKADKISEAFFMTNNGRRY